MLAVFSLPVGVGLYRAEGRIDQQGPPHPGIFTSLGEGLLTVLREIQSFT
jgi:hypothetical protein